MTIVCKNCQHDEQNITKCWNIYKNNNKCNKMTKNN